MSNKKLFATAGKAPAADTVNEAGGSAYAFSAYSPGHALAQYAVTGTFNGTFYATETEQLAKTLDLASRVSLDFVAKTAVFTREKGFMKDMPAFLAAYLAAKDVRLLARVFPRVIDNGKMLRNFVQIVRSGAVGRKSFGSAPKRMLRAWFGDRTPEQIFRQSLGSDPSMADVIKMIRPSPKNDNGEVDAVREALYGYLIGKDVDESKLPLVVQQFEAFKKGAADMPDVPFEMLTALDLDTTRWTEIAKRMSWTQLRMNLNTLLRHGVFEDPSMVALVAAKLANPEAVRRARAMPYQLLAAFRAASGEVPQKLRMALQEALEVAIENVPKVAGKAFLCPDVSGSMSSPVTGFRRGATTAVRCVDVAALVSAAFLRRNPDAEVLPFSDDVVKMPRPINPLDSVMSNAEYLASLPSGGTACAAPLRRLNERKAKGDLVVYVSDNQSWADFKIAPNAAVGSTRGTVMAEEWARFKARNPAAKLVLIDVQPYAHTQVTEHEDVLNIGGFSDTVFDAISLFAKGEMSAGHWVEMIQNVAI